jgi:hypothetical protein
MINASATRSTGGVMDGPQQSLASFAPRSPYAADSLRELLDADVALGCECADPALQIDCWGEEAAPLAPPRD